MEHSALAAADNAVMLLDAAKGLEPQTRKLFEVVRMRSLPLCKIVLSSRNYVCHRLISIFSIHFVLLIVVTFVNKMDRPAMSPYEIMDQIEQEFGLATYPILWPIGDGERFKGVLDRMNNIVHLFDRGDRKSKAEVEQVSMTDLETLRKSIDDDELYEKLLEDQELLVELIPPLDMDRVMNGEQSPLFFGSAMTNFGVQLFLDKFCDMGTKPSGRLATRKEEVKGTKSSDDDEVDELISPDHGEFSGFVFKTQGKGHILC